MVSKSESFAVFLVTSGTYVIKSPRAMLHAE
jgi:hypothetical protein